MIRIFQTAGRWFLLSFLALTMARTAFAQSDLPGEWDVVVIGGGLTGDIAALED